ncbi:MAG: MEDS domain-containing protein [Candidatus Rokuibacteriota bacterium]
MHDGLRRTAEDSGGTAMGELPAWQRFVTAPAPGQHVARLYTDADLFARAVAAFLGEGLRAGDAVLIIATPPHGEKIARCLGDQGLDLDALRRRGQLSVLDAAASLARLLVDGRPDPARFRAVIGAVVDGARTAGFRRVRAFGEMVDLLRRTDLDATIRLEALWNDLLTTRGIALLCGYSVDALDPRVYRGLLQGVCTAHSDLIPVDDPARFQEAVERAYADVFGPAGDGDGLRRAFLAEYARPATMPDAEAAILAAQEFVPSVGDAILERAGRYYRAPSAAVPASDR